MDIPAEIRKSSDRLLDIVPPRNGNGGNGWRGMPHSRSNYSLPIHPARFGLWLFIAASIMLFAAFTSAYIVRAAAGDWMRISVPAVMWLGTAALIMSSISIHAALVSIRKNNFTAFMRGMVLSVLFGGLFVGGQFAGWSVLRETGIYVGTNASSSFFFMLTAAHAVHLAGGMAALLYVTVKGIRRKFNADDHLGVELCATYWHFLDALWVYLLLFMNIV
jgi:cytochrome c oxidase subunit III